LVAVAAGEIETEDVAETEVKAGAVEKDVAAKTEGCVVEEKNNGVVAKVMAEAETRPR
jgi:hypothetical protein